jgi:NAD(P)-dependent dehydrogenase (short-subunit alcohol dehydrogenase family)
VPRRFAAGIISDSLAACTRNRGRGVSAPIAVVTGGGRRLGRAIALALAREGFDLLVTYRGSESGAHACVAAARGLGRRAHSFQADLGLPGECDAVAAAAVGLFGGADLLVNNAAVFPEETLDDVTPESWSEVSRVNLLAPLLLTRALAPALAERRGAVVHLGSLGGVIAYRKHVGYSLSKAALAHLTRAQARRYAPLVRVNSIAPGGVALDEREPVGAGADPEASVGHGETSTAPERLPPVGRIPLGRLATAEEITAAVVFLGTTARYVTGQTLVVDGGRSIV